MTLRPPVALNDHHRLDRFDCGLDSLDEWLVHRARSNSASGATRTYVVCDDDRVVGYYALAAGNVAAIRASGPIRRNMPDPIPTIILGRFAIDRSYQKQGLGRALFRDGASRVVAAAGIIGVRGLLTHAISEEARVFYLTLGMVSSAIEPMTLMTTLSDLQASLTAGP